MSLRRVLFFLFLVFLLVPATAAQARRGTGDLFGDADWTAQPRPREARRDWAGDVFRPYPLLVNENADLFGHVRPTRVATREDVLAPYPSAPPVGRLFDPWADRAD